jgi:hypothetical protein
MSQDKTSRDKMSKLKKSQDQNFISLKTFQASERPDHKMSLIQNVPATKWPKPHFTNKKNPKYKLSQVSKCPKYKTSQATKRPEILDWKDTKCLGLWGHICQLVMQYNSSEFFNLLQVCGYQ